MNAPVLAERGAACLTLPGVPGSVGQARAFVRGQLDDGTGGVVGELAVSELATNAITHTKSGEPGGTFTVTVRPVVGGSEVAVFDAGGLGAPAVAEPGGDAEHGRGLAIVAALASSWGTAPAEDGGRVTWCQIGATP